MTESEAIAVATYSLAGIGGTDDVLYTAHGLGVTQVGQAPEPVWLVVVAADQTPRPGGPACATVEGCTPAFVIKELAGAIVSYASGEVTRMFSRGYVATPAP